MTSSRASLDETFWAIGESRFVLLTTYRRTGVGVATVVWVARDGDHLVVTTPVGAAKVRRLRHDARASLTPCGRLGRVADGAPVVHVQASVLGPDEDVPSATAALRRKYGVQYTGVLRVESTVRRRRHGKDDGRVILALAAPSAAPS